jgi:hypothetical protein
MRRLVDRVVAVATIHVQRSSMQLVAEWHWLFWRVPNVHGTRGRTVRPECNDISEANRDCADQDRHNFVRPRREGKAFHLWLRG